MWRFWENVLLKKQTLEPVQESVILVATDWNRLIFHRFWIFLLHPKKSAKIYFHTIDGRNSALPVTYKKSKDNMGILSMISSVGKLSVFVGFCWTCPDDLTSEGGLDDPRSSHMSWGARFIPFP